MGGLITVVVFAIIIILVVASSIRIVPQSEAYVVERLGAYLTTWNVGVKFKVPFIDRIARHVSLKEMVADEEHNHFVAPLINYNLDDDALRIENGIENGFTVKALYRLGFKWSIIDMDYLKKTVEMLKTLGFFER